MLRNFWYVTATSKELGAIPLQRTICGIPTVLFRDSMGKAAAVQGYCSHRRAPLSMGRIVQDSIECPYHGMRFDRSGRCVHIPSQQEIPEPAHISAFPVVEQQGLVWLWPGEPAAADLAKVPYFPWRTDSAWNAETIYHYHVLGGYLLMTDNLLDLGHVAFIHADTIGFDPGELKNDPLETTVVGDQIVNSRVFHHVAPSPAVASWGKFSGRVERRSISTWSLPCFTSIEFTNRDETTAIEMRIDHLITPETERTHNYWVSVSRNFRIDDHALTIKMHQDNDRVHQQDLAIVEAQQRMIDLVPDCPDMPLRQDRAVTIAHRKIARLELEEVARRSAKLKDGLTAAQAVSQPSYLEHHDDAPIRT
jgi:vanillate O-demethylase monooxygenase subunit